MQPDGNYGKKKKFPRFGSDYGYYRAINRQLIGRIGRKRKISCNIWKAGVKYAWILYRLRGKTAVFQNAALIYKTHRK
ncbi:MAG: hypothetical protein LIP12_07040 [Clostridiales bacterium]|nr:hypothetical protein [Clostridiales bacterium]